MAKSTNALNQLQEQIEAVRREAYAAGYEAAMQSLREFASRPNPQQPAAGGAEAAPARRRQPAQRKRQARRTEPERPAPQRGGRGRQPARQQPAQREQATSGRRLGRGNNARLIEEVLQAVAPRALRPTEIRTALQRDKGVAMAFTSIRHALGQLEARGSIQQVADSKTWRSAQEGGG